MYVFFLRIQNSQLKSLPFTVHLMVCNPVRKLTEFSHMVLTLRVVNISGTASLGKRISNDCGKTRLH